MFVLINLFDISIRVWFSLQSDTLNPFDVNGQVFNALNGNVCDSEKEASSDKEKKDDENNVVLTNEQMALLEDQRQELADLRRQVVFLQVSQQFSILISFSRFVICFQAFRDKKIKIFKQTKTSRNRFIDSFIIVYFQST